MRKIVCFEWLCVSSQGPNKKIAFLIKNRNTRNS